MRLRFRCTYVAASVVLAGVIVMPVRAKAASPASSPKFLQTGYAGQASVLIQKIQQNAATVRNEADKLGVYAKEAYHPTEVGYQADAETLTRIRSRVNAMDRMLYQLRTRQGRLQAWQRQAVNRLAPDIVDLTDSTEAAILAVNRNRPHLFTSQLDLYSSDIYHLSNRISATAEDFEMYAKDHKEVAHLRRLLHLQS